MRFLLILLLGCCSGGIGAEAGRKTICLNMIVKNEASIITRCLASVMPIIDHWVIVDTGSTDGTQQIIREFMKDIPGELYERPWKNFEHNRNEALALAKGKGDYILIMDADDTLEFDPGFNLPQLTAESYRLWIKLEGVSYQRHQIINSKLPWKWVGVLHETLVCAAQGTSEIMEGVKIIVGTDGARAKDPKRFEKDAAVLEEAIKSEPENTRYMYYLAQSYRDAGNPEKAVEWFLKRVAKGGRDEEEIYWALIQVGLLEQKLKKPDWAVADRFLNAFYLHPYRPEAVMYLADMYRLQRRFDMAYALIKLWQSMPKPAIGDLIFVQEWMLQYGILFELSVTSGCVGQYQESLDACNRLLAMENLPEELRVLTVPNQQFALQKLEEQRKILAAFANGTLTGGAAADQQVPVGKDG